MCKNCKNSSIEILKNSRWYFSPKLYKDIKECDFCFQIEEERLHEHVESEDWQYDRGNYRDVTKCKVCGMVLQERTHLDGFQDEHDTFEDYLHGNDAIEESKEEVYTRGRYLKNA